MFSCVFKEPAWLNFLSHFEQLNGFSLVWTLLCVIKLFNVFPCHTWAAEWFLPSVDPLMNFQFGRLYECFVTPRTTQPFLIIAWPFFWCHWFICFASNCSLNLHVFNCSFLFHSENWLFSLIFFTSCAAAESNSTVGSSPPSSS